MTGTTPPPARRPSMRSRVIYATSRRVAPPTLARWILRPDNQQMADRLTRVGGQINRVARLQRRRPFRGIEVVRDVTEGFPIEMVQLADSHPSLSEGAILYFHGGGFITGGLDSHLHVAAILARRMKLPVAHVDYRQYPEVTVDGSVDDCCRAYRRLLDQGADPAKVVIAGDSAGGFLAFATTLEAQRRGMPTPAGVIGISALLDLDNAAREAHENASRDALGAHLVLPTIIDHICPSNDARRALSPINGPYESMPPVLLIAADTEILRSDAERLHGALQQAGRTCRLEVWPSQLHAFPAMLPFLPESKAAFDSIVRFTRLCMSEQGGETA